MEKIYLSSTLLVPMPKNDEKYSFFWAGTLKSEIETVNIIVFNCDAKNQFQPMLKIDLASLMQMRRQRSKEIGRLKKEEQPTADKICQMRNIKNQIRFIKKTLFQMANDVYIKRPQQGLLDVVAQKLHTQVTAKNVIYLSGVSRIEKY